MNLETYFKQPGALTVRRLSDAIGVSPDAVRQWMSGLRPVPARRAVQVERVTGGRVRRQDLAPEWAEIWPELAQPVVAWLWQESGRVSSASEWAPRTREERRLCRPLIEGQAIGLEELEHIEGAAHGA